jgi:hypothetical protein
MSNSLYGRLFKYRERKTRTPLENFLTEALADLINRLPKDELDDFVASLLLDADAAKAWRDLTARGQVKISCKTQFPITSGSILDILFVADDATPLLVIENKIAAAVRTDLPSEHDEGDRPSGRAEETVDQLQEYGRWLAEQCSSERSSWKGALTLLTHWSPAPESFCAGGDYGVPWQKTCRWYQVWRWLKEKSGADQSETWSVLAGEIASFLEENDMTTENMTHYDLALAEVYLHSGADVRINSTFRIIGERLKNCLATLPCPCTSRQKHVGYAQEGSVMWDWINMKQEPAWDWYLAWGLRFPTHSQWWTNVTPPLMSNVTYAFTSFSWDGKKEPQVGTLPEKLFPKGWIRTPDDDFVAFQPVQEFRADPDQFAAAMGEWVTEKIDAFKPALSHLLRAHAVAPAG